MHQLLRYYLGCLQHSYYYLKLNETTLSGWIGDTLKDAAPILLITGAGGSFGTVIKNSGVADILQEMDLGVLCKQVHCSYLYLS